VFILPPESEVCKPCELSTQPTTWHSHMVSTTRLNSAYKWWRRGAPSPCRTAHSSRPKSEAVESAHSCPKGHVLEPPVPGSNSFRVPCGIFIYALRRGCGSLPEIVYSSLTDDCLPRWPYRNPHVQFAWTKGVASPCWVARDASTSLRPPSSQSSLARLSRRH
jgi:hypothetical protein